MSWVVAGAVVGTGVITAYMGNQAAQSAADSQSKAAGASNATQLQMYNQQRADLEPWRQAGGVALGQMQGADYQRDFTQADFKKDPGYDFRMAEGQKALERSASARGGLQSGGTLKALSRYSQGVASDEYNNAYNRFNGDRDRRFNRLASLAGVGQTANAQNAAGGQNYANQYGQNVMGSANAQGAAQMAQANNMTNLAQTGTNTWMQYQMMNRLAPVK